MRDEVVLTHSSWGPRVPVVGVVTLAPGHVQIDAVAVDPMWPVCFLTELKEIGTLALVATESGTIR